MGTKFYVIIKGSVSVNVRFLVNPEEKREESAKLQNLTSSTLPVEYVLKEIKILNAGLAFGELSLIENKPRAATIICVEDCGFAVLDKKNFDVILSKRLVQVLGGDLNKKRTMNRKKSTNRLNSLPR